VVRGVGGRKKGRAPARGLAAIARGARASELEGETVMKRITVLAVAVASFPAMALAQNPRSQPPSYCFDLSRITDLAATKERFASIAGRPRQGDFRDTSLTLPNWNDCSPTYTCAYAEMESVAEAEKARAATLGDVKTCLGAGWAEAAERSSPSYVVLHNMAQPVAITLSTDQSDSKKYVVRLTVFVRRN